MYIYIYANSCILKDEAMIQKYLAVPSDDEITTKVEFSHTWTIDSWKELPTKLYSPEFEGGDFTWKVYLFPEGNNSPSVSIYLACAPKGQDPASPLKEGEAANWTCCAQFQIVMWNDIEDTYFVQNTAFHRFEAEEADWGFSQFCDFNKLQSKLSPEEHSLIEGNKVNITVNVRILNDPTGVLWHNFRNYNSRKETGYSGMKNQGATCYLNSLLQSLYFTTAFRHAVMGIPTDDEPEKVPAALQRVFSQLATSDDAVDTRRLTKSFGWDSGDAFTQHDVQELNRVLMDNLEGKMKGTSVEGLLNKIFVGQMKSFIKCVNVDFESSRIEDYWDIQLNVKGMKNLEASFKDYVQVETLDGENQYQATGFGLQDAKKGVVFKSFPPVLHLQLKRYDFDFIREQMVKINDRYEFPTEIDLSPYLEEPNGPCEYALHGVLVHCGDLNIGHYYALIKPKRDSPWYKFDDERVTRATMKEVLEDNFGGEISPSEAAKLRVSRMSSAYKKHTSAYMLVYIDKSRVDELLYDEQVPEHILNRVKAEIEQEERIKKEREEQHLYMTVRVATNKQFQNFGFFDLAIFDPLKPGLEKQPEEAHAVPIRAKKDTKIHEFLQIVANNLGYENPNALRLWTMAQRDNKTNRPSKPVEHLNDTLISVFDKRHEVNEGCFYLEEAELDPETGKIVPWVDKDSRENPKLLIFIKVFEPGTQTLHGVTTYVGRRKDKVGTLIPTALQALGWSENTEVRLLEEIKPLMVDVTSPASTFGDAELGDGDIICIEKVVPDQPIPAGGFKAVTEYYEFLNNRVLVTFRRHSELDGFSDEAPETEVPDFELWLTRNNTYDQMTEIVGKELGVDPTHLRFFTPNQDGSFKQVLRKQTLVSHMITTSYRSHTNRVILYEILPMSADEYENKKLVKFVYLTDGLSQEHRLEVLLPKATGTVADLIPVLANKSKLSETDESKLHFWTAQNHIFFQEIKRDMLVNDIADNLSIYAQLYTDEEFESLNSQTTETATLKVFQFHREPAHTHGVPFLFVVKPGEKFKDSKARLQKKLGVFDKIFERIKFALIADEFPNKPRYIEEGEEEELVLYDFRKEDVMLGLDHVTKAPRRVHGERAIFIKN